LLLKETPNASISARPKYDFLLRDLTLVVPRTSVRENQLASLGGRSASGS